MIEIASSIERKIKDQDKLHTHDKFNIIDVTYSYIFESIALRSRFYFYESMKYLTFVHLK